MKVELPIDNTKKLPNGAFPTLEKELLKRLQNRFDECSLVMCRAGFDESSVDSGEKEAKKQVGELLQQTGESADDWFF